MKFLVVQEVYAATIVYLRAFGHDVVTAAELGLEEAADEFLLERAEEQNVFSSRATGITAASYF